MRFVIADDSQIVRDILSSTLRRAGHDVVAAVVDGAAAVTACEQQRPDAVILDVLMPPVNGDVAAKEIVARALCAHVFVASSNSQEIVFGPLRALGVHVLSKPYHPAQLCKQIEAAYGEH